jgi:hypothetical protein
MWFALARLFPSPNFDVSLADIAEIQRLPGEMGDVSPFVPILGVTLASGGQLFVQLVDIDAWLEALEAALQASGHSP